MIAGTHECVLLADGTLLDITAGYVELTPDSIAVITGIIWSKIGNPWLLTEGNA